MWQLKNIKTGYTHNCAERPKWIAGVWECGAFRITDASGAEYAVIEPVSVPPKVSPVEFKLLFTRAERVAIKASTDPVVLDFFSIVEDQRLTHVDLALQSTQDALSYLESKALIAVGRKAAILTGMLV